MNKALTHQTLDERMLVVQRAVRKSKRVAGLHFLFAGLLLGLLVAPDTRELVMGALADAYWAVASFVAFTLALVYWAKAKAHHVKPMASWISGSPTRRVVLAACLGSLPGCGGAIIVMMQFVKGQLSFGSVVAVLTATMGDAAFFLLAAVPQTDLLVIGLSLVAGMAMGLVVDRIHGADYLRPRMPRFIPSDKVSKESVDASWSVRFEGFFWRVAMIPTVVIGFMMAFQYDFEVLFSLPPGTMVSVGALLGFTGVVLWSMRPGDASRPIEHEERQRLFDRVALETNTVLGWVVMGFVAFELLIHLTGLDLQTLFVGIPGVAILAAIAVGWIPGCGPQIVTSTLYISGVIPLSAQLGNAISNDGDALFPALALAPKAALMATVYSTVPALVVAFGYAILFEW